MSRRWTLVCVAALFHLRLVRGFVGTARTSTRRLSRSVQPNVALTVHTDLYLSTNSHYESIDDYFVREAVIADMGEASRILTEGFYGDKDFIVKAYERFRTYLSLESDFPKEMDQHQILVACRSSDGRVVALCDVDNRTKQQPRPYMCNLAVDPAWRGRGLAKALIRESEVIMSNRWYLDESFLKVKERNEAAVSLYKNLGYRVDSQSVDPGGDVLLTMRKALPHPQSSITETIADEQLGWIHSEIAVCE